jgi:HEAT repeat protein
MTADKDPQVRSAAVFAVGFRSAEPFIAPLIEAARKDPVQYVRLGAIKRLREHADESPRIATALAGIAANDPSAAVRRVAAADGQ